MLTKAFLNAPERGCYNLHGSILPHWRGAAPIARGVLAGDAEYGVTLYQMVRALDAGPVVACSRIQPSNKQSAGDLELQLSHLAAELLDEKLSVLLAGELELTPQDDTLATYAPKLEKSEGWINWAVSPGRVEDQVLGLDPWPRSFSQLEIQGKVQRVFIDQVVAVGESAAAMEPVAAMEPGAIREIREDGILVACGAGGTSSLLLTQLQRAGKKSIPAADFIRGNSLEPGQKFDNSL